MKIGIITQPLKENFGGVLQNYALQTVLKDNGHIAITIDCIPENSFWLYSLVTIKTILLSVFCRKKRAYQPYRYKRNWKTQLFIDKNLFVTKRCQSYSNKILRTYGFNALIVGSDQVWRPDYNKKTLKDMFLDFCKNEKILKIAYAASFGVNNWEYDQVQSQMASTLIKNFKAVSVRETSAVYLCDKYLGIKAVDVLDPTLLLSVDKYKKLIPGKLLNKEKYIFVYLLDDVDNRKHEINFFAKQNNIKVKYCEANDKISCSIEQWIAYFNNASYVITDSFHGTVFSIIFNKQFLSINNMKRGTARFTDLLSIVGLEGRLVKNIDYTLLVESIDWEEINNRISKKREESLEFIKVSLKE